MFLMRLYVECNEMYDLFRGQEWKAWNRLKLDSDLMLGEVAIELVVLLASLRVVEMMILGL